MANEQDLKELQALLKDYETAMLTTRGSDGHYHSRPMAIQKRDLRYGMWFATYRESAKIQELEAHPDCAVSLFKGGHSATYVSISGTAKIVADREVIRRMWDLSWKPWFPNGPEDPDLVLIRVEPEHAEFVHPQTGRLAVLFTMAKRLITKEKEEPAPKKEIDFPERPGINA